jgi:WXG100 family type VII secretion target
MTRLVVDLAQLAELLDEMERAHGQLARVHADVTARVGQLHGTWRGPAAAAQVTAQARWAGGAVEVQEALAVLRGIVRAARVNYQAAVIANRQMWSL